MTEDYENTEFEDEELSQSAIEARKAFLSKRKKIFSVEKYLEGIRLGDRTMLGLAITLIESSLPQHKRIAQKLVEACRNYCGGAIRIGITGIPGVGKSTFIESFGKHLTSLGKSVAVLAVDPSSEKTKGSILGDKTRMEILSNDQNAFIRPSPSSGALGGVNQKTREAIILAEAAGFDVIIVETVGVGQSEIAVHNMVDFFILLLIPGAGDELQGIKRGIMEIADLFVINKADGDLKIKADIARQEIENVIHMFSSDDSSFSPRAMTCSALHKKGIDAIWDTICSFHFQVSGNDEKIRKRRNQDIRWLHESIENQLKELFYSNEVIANLLKDAELRILNGYANPITEADKLLDKFVGARRK